MRLTLTAPAGFSFRGTVFSHGWYDLAPFAVERSGRTLVCVTPPSAGGPRLLRLAWSGGRVRVDAAGPAGPAARRAVRAAVRRVLSLDVDLAPFHAVARESDGLAWVADEGAGRMLRGTSVFEDLVKLVLTTNCTWALTRRMVGALVEQLGEAGRNGVRAFPTAEAIAGAGEAVLRHQIRVGYRAPLLAALAEAVAAGRVDPASWERDPRPPAELRRELIRLPGVGPYVAENMLKLIGRPAGLALDSWLRAEFARVYHGGRKVSDRTIARRYARFADWAGMALWCDMTRGWLSQEGIPQWNGSD